MLLLSLLGCVEVWSYLLCRLIIYTKVTHCIMLCGHHDLPKKDYIIVLVGDTIALIFNRDSWIYGIYTCKMTAIYLS